jgi:hypothetical protein
MRTTKLEPGSALLDLDRRDCAASTRHPPAFVDCDVGHQSTSLSWRWSSRPYLAGKGCDRSRRAWRAGPDSVLHNLPLRCPNRADAPRVVAVLVPAGLRLGRTTPVGGIVLRGRIIREPRRWITPSTPSSALEGMPRTSAPRVRFSPGRALAACDPSTADRGSALGSRGRGDARSGRSRCGRHHR